MSLTLVMMACATISISLVPSPSISITLPRKNGWVPGDTCPMYGESVQYKAQAGNRPMLDRKQLITAYPPRPGRASVKKTLIILVRHIGLSMTLRLHVRKQPSLRCRQCQTTTCRVQSFTQTSLDCIHTDTLRFLKNMQWVHQPRPM